MAINSWGFLHFHSFFFSFSVLLSLVLAAFNFSGILGYHKKFSAFSTYILLSLYHLLSLSSLSTYPHLYLFEIPAFRPFRFYHQLSKMMPNHSSSSIGVLSHASIQSKNSVARLPDLRILHFNDVYNIAGFAKEPVGGIARFESRINHYRDGKDFQGQPELLTLFSGDCLNPSLESIFTKGKCAFLLDVSRFS